MDCVGYLLLFAAVKEFLKICWQLTKLSTYRHEFGVVLFWDTVYMA